LIADDEPAILEIMEKKMTREGFDVITAADGAEAWEKIRAQSPDIVILDRTMPAMSGFSVLQMLRENPPHKKWIPVIIVSALGEVKDVEEGMSLQADHYLVKPCPVEEILKGVRLMLSLIPLRKADAEI
jgi:DNA-binding response OmpR family regulator